MSDEKSELMMKIKKMPLEEILKYESAAVTAGRILNTIGISCFLLMFFFPEVLVILVCAPIIMLVAHAGTGIGNTLSHIRHHLQNMKC
jgi:hypothetical protein